MLICAKKSVLIVILFPHQHTNSSDTTTNMFSSKCVLQANTEENLAEHTRDYMKELNTFAANANIKHQQKGILLNITGEYIKK